MTDYPGMAEIRGLEIQTLVQGFADEEIIMKKYVTISPTSAREIRWYSKTSGFLDNIDSTGITASQMANQDELALPVYVEQGWTRTSSYVRKYIAETFLSDEDIKDNDVDVLATHLQDISRGIAHQVDTRIWDVITESRSVTNINSYACPHEWDDAAACNPVSDALICKRLIRDQSYNPEGAVLFLNPSEHQYLISWLISQKGSSIPQFASEKVVSGRVMEFVGLNVVVSTAVTKDYAAIMIPNRAATWKQFTPLTAKTIEDPGLGVKVRIWEEGECILHDPKAVCLLSNVGPT